MLPIAAMSLIFVMLIPLPTALMDILLAANLTFSAIVLVTTIFVESPLEFSVFPSMLLGSTLFRLVLNCATTRLILTAGERGGDPMIAAGQVVYTFGNFVAGGSLAVGLIIFIILIVIQFVVITKGATRISEVAARFTLDGMPGKQMAIDADLNAGLINEGEARRRREAITREADFYGAMDGASKFVRGDAIAGIIITLVNVIGGLAVGMLQYGWTIGTCTKVFTTLTIGDGLVSQIPAFIISISAGLIVTRSTSRSNLSDELITQLTSKPRAMIVTAVLLSMLALTPLPKVPLLVLAGGCVAIARLIENSRKQKSTAQRDAEKASSSSTKPAEDKIESLLPVDRMELEIGYALIRLVDAKQGGDLLHRISMIRRQIALELGMVVPSIRIRDNVRLEPNDYAIKIKGVEVARGKAYPDQFLAMDSGAVTGKVTGMETKEPAFGLPAVWVPAARKEQAEMMNYTVVDASSVLATHLTEIIKNHAAELFTRQDLTSLLDNVKEKSPALVEDVIGGSLKAADVQKVLQALLAERVPIRDMETVLETLGEWGGRTQDTEILTEYVRNALARTICNQYRSEEGSLRCVTLDPGLEDVINRHIERTDRGGFLTLPPAMAQKIVRAVSEQLDYLLQIGASPVILCSPQIRLQLRNLISGQVSQVAVLAYNEVPRGVKIESLGMVVVENSPSAQAQPALA